MASLVDVQRAADATAATPGVGEPDLETVEMTITMGPQHPSTHGVFRMVLTLEGERVKALEPFIGYLHRGAEKLGRPRAWRATARP